MKMKSLFNFRDLGGPLGHGGRPVRRNRLFRSESFANFSSGEIEAFESLDIRTVIDLRTQAEVLVGGAAPAAPGRRFVHFSPQGNGPTWDTFDDGMDLGRFYADRYLAMATDTSAEMGGAIRVIAEQARLPILMYCHAGRDRTGVLAALTLALLGVSDDDITADYVRSADGERRYNQWLQRTRPVETLPPAARVATPPSAIRLFLADLRHRHGGIEEYARSAGVASEHLSQLCSNLLVDADRSTVAHPDDSHASPARAANQ